MNWSEWQRAIGKRLYSKGGRCYNPERLSELDRCREIQLRNTLLHRNALDSLIDDVQNVYSEHDAKCWILSLPPIFTSIPNPIGKYFRCVVTG